MGSTDLERCPVCGRYRCYHTKEEIEKAKPSIERQAAIITQLFRGNDPASTKLDAEQKTDFVWWLSHRGNKD